MIKRTESKNQLKPKIMKNKCSYGNKGTVSLKTKKGSFSANSSSNPGMGKGKARGMGDAISGGKFSGVY
tara:strand:+ start:568 stop:774 length:207 start_codon:yes stop_codon:yes gene_type:complete